MRPRAGAQALHDLLVAQRRVQAEHVGNGAGHLRRGKAGAVQTRIAARCGHGAAAVGQRHQATVGQHRAPGALAVVAGHRGNAADADLAAEVRVVGLEAVTVEADDADHAGATGRARRTGPFVARRGHHHHADGAQLVHGALVRRAAGRAATEADVDDSGRIRIECRPFATGRPAAQRMPSTMSGKVGAALAGHTHRQDRRAPMDAGAAFAVVGVGRHHAGDDGAVPGAASPPRSR